MGKKKSGARGTEGESGAKAAKGSKKRVKQTELPGMERKHVKEVEDAAEAYETTRDARIKLSGDESEKLESLVSVMEKHGLKVYRNDEAVPPMLVTLKAGKTKAKVERLTGDAD